MADHPHNPFSHNPGETTGGPDAEKVRNLDHASGPTTGTESNRADAGPTGWRDPGEGQLRTGGQGEKTFRCADVGNATCQFEAAGRTEEEVMAYVETHCRQEHGVRDCSPDLRKKWRSAIQERRAA